MHNGHVNTILNVRLSRRLVWWWQPSGIWRRVVIAHRSDDGSSMHLWNVGIILRDYTAPYLKRLLLLRLWSLHCQAIRDEFHKNSKLVRNLLYLYVQLNRETDRHTDSPMGFRGIQSVSCISRNRKNMNLTPHSLDCDPDLRLCSFSVSRCALCCHSQTCPMYLSGAHRLGRNLVFRSGQQRCGRWLLLCSSRGNALPET
jgi:hypothetical protein